jgi:hypothetical protein
MAIGKGYAPLVGTLILVILTACSGPRPVSSDYGQFRSTLEGDDVLVAYYKDYQSVQQSAPDLCWAAALQQSLGRLGVDIDQTQIVNKFYPGSDGKESRTSNLLQWYLHPVFKEPIRNGSEAWIRLDIDHHDTDMYRYDFVAEVADELSANRIPLIGISTGLGQGHMVTVIGAAYPIDVKQLTTWRIRGFLIYDPLTARPYLVSSSDLYSKAEYIISVVAFDRQIEAVIYCGRHCSRKPITSQ